VRKVFNFWCLESPSLQEHDLRLSLMWKIFGGTRSVEVAGEPARVEAMENTFQHCVFA
jgi:hypothetical protein